MRVSELARRVRVHPTHIFKILAGERYPSRELATLLARHTHTSREAWLYPHDTFNPLEPYFYRSEWPPDLSHLTGKARRWAEEIIKAFPHRPPTREEFRAWKRAMRRKARKGGTGDERA